MSRTLFHLLTPPPPTAVAHNKMLVAVFVILQTCWLSASVPAGDSVEGETHETMQIQLERKYRISMANPRPAMRMTQSETSRKHS